jgi:hypothetical protein
MCFTSIYRLWRFFFCHRLHPLSPPPLAVAGHIQPPRTPPSASILQHSSYSDNAALTCCLIYHGGGMGPIETNSPPLPTSTLPSVVMYISLDLLAGLGSLGAHTNQAPTDASGEWLDGGAEDAPQKCRLSQPRRPVQIITSWSVLTFVVNQVFLTS